MKRVCVIGLGNFGFHVARTLYEDGHEVLAVDTDREKVQGMRDHASLAIIADASNKDFLVGQGIDKMDAVVVSTGERSHLATLITLHLKELGLKKILVKALNEDHGRILEKVGATQVIFPEKDMAIKTARSIASPNILEFISMGEGYSLSEAEPPANFIGKSLAQLDIRQQHGVTVLGIRDGATNQFVLLPPASKVIEENDLLLFVGTTKSLEELFRAKG